MIDKVMASSFSRLFDYLRNPLKGRSGGTATSAPSPAVLRQPDTAPPRRASATQPTPDELRRQAYQEWLDRRQKLETELEARNQEIRQADPVWRFVHLGETKTWPASSNVSATWYNIAANQLFVTYHDGSTYSYENVSPAEAESLARSQSAGTWIWDNVRIRGTRNGARKEYHLDVSPEKGRAWEQTEGTAREHAERVSATSGAKSAYEKLGKFALKRPVTNKGRRARPEKF